jgi:hypothetical protein
MRERPLSESRVRVIGAPGAIGVATTRTQRQIPRGRTAFAEEEPAAISCLPCPEADYDVGSVLVPDGGMLLYPNFV